MKKNRIYWPMVFCAALFLLCAGCSAFTPPPYIDARMDVQKGPDGKITGARFSRSVSGYAHAEPESVILDWAGATQAGCTGTEEGTCPAIASDPTCRGVIINRTGGTRTAEIFRKGSKRPFAVFVFDKTDKIDAALPYGQYQTVWRRGTESVVGRPFEVRPGKTTKLDNKEYGWVQTLDP